MFSDVLVNDYLYRDLEDFRCSARGAASASREARARRPRNFRQLVLTKIDFFSLFFYSL